jgi:hypothetical protein
VWLRLRVCIVQLLLSASHLCGKLYCGFSMGWGWRASIVYLPELSVSVAMSMARVFFSMSLAAMLV